MDIKRIRRIEQLSASIQECNINNKLVDYKKLAFAACTDWGCSLRTATEYVKIAKFRAENEEEEKA